MKSPDHVRANLELASVDPCDEHRVEEALGAED
jgi:hypothetical protein